MAAYTNIDHLFNAIRYRAPHNCAHIQCESCNAVIKATPDQTRMDLAYAANDSGWVYVDVDDEDSAVFCERCDDMNHAAYTAHMAELYPDEDVKPCWLFREYA